MSQLGAQDQPVDVVEARCGRVLVGRPGRQQRAPDARLDHVDRGVRGDDEEPVHQRSADRMIDAEQHTSRPAW